MIFNVEEMLAPGSGVVRLEKRIEALEAKLAELEKRLTEPAPPVNTGTTEPSFPAMFIYCPKCGVHTQHKPSGKILTSVPPQTELACIRCGLTRGVE